MSISLLKQCVLSGYFWASWPSRRRAAAERAKQEWEPVSILFYHRVADEYPNGWTMPTTTFAKQIAWLRSRFDIVSLADAQARIAAGRNDQPTVCITFDDGYADNMRFAVPLLLEHAIPFAYFISTSHVIAGEPFPHDVKAGRPLRPNKVEDLRVLSAAGVEIGGHTRNHADLGGDCAMSELEYEIAGCKRDLEVELQTSVRYFAFPYGLHANLSAAAFRAAYEAGFEGVCSAYGGYNFPGDDPFHLRRIHADPEPIRIKNWLTVDKRKCRLQRDFDPGDYRDSAVTHPRDAGACLQLNAPLSC